MRINNNLMAMNTHRQLGINSENGAKSIEKLSSGYRINRAGDDAAGLAISEKMRGQIRGLNQASRNSQDAISLVQTAEGALNESQAILQRMRELAVQSANDTNESEDRDAIQNEIDQLTSELNRISETTEFNKKKLLNGDLSDEAASKALSASGLALDADAFAGSGAITLGDDVTNGEYDITVVNDIEQRVADNQSQVMSAGSGVVSEAVAGDVTLDEGSYEVVFATTDEARSVASYGGSTSGADYLLASGTNDVTIDATSALNSGDFDIAIRKYTDETVVGIDTGGLSGVDNSGVAEGVYAVTTSAHVSGAESGGSHLLTSGIVSSITIADDSTYNEVEDLYLSFNETANVGGDGSGTWTVSLSGLSGISESVSFSLTAAGGAATLQLGDITVEVDLDALRDSYLSGTISGADTAIDGQSIDLTMYNKVSVEQVSTGATDELILADGAVSGAHKFTFSGDTGALKINIEDNGGEFVRGNTYNTSITYTDTYEVSLVANGAGTPAAGSGSVTLTEDDLSSAFNNINLGSGVMIDLSKDHLELAASGAYTIDINIDVTQETTASLQTADGSGISTIVVSGGNSGTAIEFGSTNVAINYNAATVGSSGSVYFSVKDSEDNLQMTLTRGAVSETVSFDAGDEVDFSEAGITVQTEDTIASGDDSTFTVTDGTGDQSVKMQIGANTGQKISIAIDDMGASAIGVSATDSGATTTVSGSDGQTYTASFKSSATVEADGNATAEFSLDIGDHDKATAAIEVINTALTSISDQRAQLGAIQNRLEHTIKNLDTSAENLQASESRIRDVDMAKEMMEFTKNNILQQAAQSMLAQANQAPQGVLQLLR